MTSFLTISPTHIPGKKKSAWQHFRERGYIAIGWMHVDLAGKSVSEVEEIIRAHGYPNEASAVDSFAKFLALRPGDHVAVNNSGHGLFGIGVVSSGYRFEDRRHDTGTEDRDHWYSHLIGVDWKSTTYVRRKDLLREGETSWSPYGTTGALLGEVPDYVKRVLGEATVDAPPTIPFKTPDWLLPLAEAISNLRKDPKHQERAHESLAEDLLVALGYKKHEDIKYRQGRIDITLCVDGRPVLLLEVKRSWELGAHSSDVIRQAYQYAHEQGIRFVAITNGDYYLLFDRLKGLSYENNIVGEFTLSSLEEEDLELIDSLRPRALERIDVKQILSRLSEAF